MTTTPINIQQLTSLLKTNFDPKASTELDAHIEFRLGDESLLLLIRDEKLTIDRFDESSQSPEIILFFESAQLAYEIFTGTKEWVHAFMKGQLRSDSNLIWVFLIVGALKKA